jgi:vacuolar-type H+-ATPase subunit H
MQEYWGKIRQSLEADCNKMKARAEMESRLILSRAKEEAENILSQAREEAKAESERILAEAEIEAEEMIQKSREEIAQSRQESIKILGETGTTIKAEMERLAAAIMEAETKLQTSRKIPDQEIKSHSQHTAGEAVNSVAPANKKTEQAISTIAGKDSLPIKESDDPELFQGKLKIEIVPPFNQEHTKGVPETLARFTSCKVVPTGGYISGNRRISTFNINLDEPVALFKIIKDIPAVKEVAEQDGDIIITLK